MERLSPPSERLSPSGELGALGRELWDVWLVARVAVYGGSFDPPHVGHVLAATYVLSVGLADRVLVVPVFQHAFHKELSPYDDRLALCRAAFCGQEGVELSDIERTLPTPNYTLATILALAQARPADELHLLVGADAFADSSKWHRFDELARLAPPIVLGRVGANAPGAPPPVLPGVSSTQVRSWLSQRDVPEVFARLQQTVPAAVLAEISRRKLYRAD